MRPCHMHPGGSLILSQSQKVRLVLCGRSTLRAEQELWLKQWNIQGERVVYQQIDLGEREEVFQVQRRAGQARRQGFEQCVHIWCGTKCH